MNRIQKKCFIASAGIHLLLLGVLLIGPAFLSRDEPPAEIKLIKLPFEPEILTDRPGRGGGPSQPKPQQRAPAPAPTPPPVQAPPEQIRAEPQIVQPPKKNDPPAQKPVVREEKNDPVSLEKTQKTARKVEVSTKLVTRNSSAANTKTDSKAEVAERQKQLDQISRSIGSIKNSLSSETPVNVSSGFGGGGASYANYRDYIGTVYFNAWLPPERAARERAVVRARVTIARDGTVLNARITEGSGDPLTDASVERTLERVRKVRSFPAESSDQQRTYPLIFDLSAKRLEG